MRTQTKWLLGIVLVLIVLVLTLSLSLTGLIIKEKSNKESIKIGGVFHLSGAGAFWGNGEYNGAALAIKEINARGGVNGKKIEMIVEDSKTDFRETSLAFNKLINLDNLKIIIGPTWFAQVASPIADESKVLILSPSGGVVPQPNKYFFDVWPTERQEVSHIIRDMKENRIKDVILIYSLNDWSESMKNSFIEEAKNQNINIVSAYPTNPDEKDFRFILSKIKSERYDAIYAPFAFYPSQGEFSKQFIEYGLKGQLYSSSGTENPALLQAYPQIEGTIYAYPKTSNKENAFRSNYEKAFNIPASPAAAYAYDSVYLIAEALKAGKTGPSEISQYLSSIKYEGVSNTIEFDKDGRIKSKEFVIKQVKNGGFVDLS